MAALSGRRPEGNPRDERLVVGLVRGVHGLRGAVRVESLTDRPSERFAPGRRLYREGSDEPLTVAAAAVDGPGWRLHFEEVADRTSAERLRGAYLEAVVEPDASLGRGEYYWHEVVGAVVRDLEGRELGRVVEVYRAGGVDAYVVRGEPYGEFDLPAVRAFIRIFAPRRGEIVVDAEALELSPARARSERPLRPRRATRRRAAIPSPPTREPASAGGEPTAPAEVTQPAAGGEPTAPAGLDGGSGVDGGDATEGSA